MRKQIAAGNWKMNTTVSEGNHLATDLKAMASCTADDVMVFAPFIHLSKVKDTLAGSNIVLGAQNLAAYTNGAYTGEVSATMLADLGIEAVLVGHSERRTLFGEDSAVLRDKIKLALDAGIRVIFCLGEPLDIREANQQEAYVLKQLEDGLFQIDDAQMANVIVAYEPIWAIGTGKTASPEQAQAMHAFIRTSLASKYGNDVADTTSILYGGSVKPANAKEIFAQPDVDGGLVGGASLKADSFKQICNAF